jgi:diadenosine tetraphosphate (Ap4A) HIT family hydrolase
MARLALTAPRTPGTAAGMGRPHADCIFCHAEHRILFRNALAFATRDEAPVSPGHTLVAPHRHCEDPFALTDAEVVACFALMRRVRDEQNDGAGAPDGYNIGVNIGVAGGQGVPHVHFHVIPRYRGDVDEPRGGIRNILPFRHRHHPA